MVNFEILLKILHSGFISLSNNDNEITENTTLKMMVFLWGSKGASGRCVGYNKHSDPARLLQRLHPSLTIFTIREAWCLKSNK